MLTSCSVQWPQVSEEKLPKLRGTSSEWAGAQPFLRKELCKQRDKLFRDGLISAPLLRLFQIRKEAGQEGGFPLPPALST